MLHKRTFGLIGYPLGHSLSVKYFSEKFEREGIRDAEYLNFPISSIDLFPDIFQKVDNLCGLNVTIPYKQSVITYLDRLSSEATAIGAVNTIKVIRDNNSLYLIGFNTDEYGFRLSLSQYLKSHHQFALILGSGGASKAVEYVLRKLNIKYKIVSRNPSNSSQISYQELNKEIMGKCTIIINTTPVGMYPKIDECPAIPYEYITPSHLLYDLTYNPEKTKFLQLGEQQGATIVNGSKMFQLQAEKSWEIWNEEY
jgi:shikimate dehydrogenase